ncbi:hypothetical protein DM01DRAFT_313351 [Hesseltinella vesiculosa]|uniref:Uncharacterized protein n=1 Tax=Hesseltinella vesiculosa TaxID=101127 RepID=A0A1X2GS69_9FUNG|nr:hypothetical protein DM01DRAFT_313351 [Hesseltinella vesiculosa]
MGMAFFLVQISTERHWGIGRLSPIAIVKAAEDAWPTSCMPEPVSVNHVSLFDDVMNGLSTTNDAPVLPPNPKMPTLMPWKTEEPDTAQTMCANSIGKTMPLTTPPFGSQEHNQAYKPQVAKKETLLSISTRAPGSTPPLSSPALANHLSSPGQEAHHQQTDAFPGWIPNAEEMKHTPGAFNNKQRSPPRPASITSRRSLHSLGQPLSNPPLFPQDLASVSSSASTSTGESKRRASFQATPPSPSNLSTATSPPACTSAMASNPLSAYHHPSSFMARMKERHRQEMRRSLPPSSSALALPTSLAPTVPLTTAAPAVPCLSPILPLSMQGSGFPMHHSRPSLATYMPAQPVIDDPAQLITRSIPPPPMSAQHPAALATPITASSSRLSFQGTPPLSLPLSPPLSPCSPALPRSASAMVDFASPPHLLAASPSSHGSLLGYASPFHLHQQQQQMAIQKEWMLRRASFATAASHSDIVFPSYAPPSGNLTTSPFMARGLPATPAPLRYSASSLQLTTSAGMPRSASVYGQDTMLKLRAPPLLQQQPMAPQPFAPQPMFPLVQDNSVERPCQKDDHGPAVRLQKKKSDALLSPYEPMPLPASFLPSSHSPTAKTGEGEGSGPMEDRSTDTLDDSLAMADPSLPASLSHDLVDPSDSSSTPTIDNNRMTLLSGKKKDACRKKKKESPRRFQQPPLPVSHRRLSLPTQLSPPESLSSNVSTSSGSDAQSIAEQPPLPHHQHRHSQQQHQHRHTDYFTPSSKRTKKTPTSCNKVSSHDSHCNQCAPSVDACCSPPPSLSPSASFYAHHYHPLPPPPAYVYGSGPTPCCQPTVQPHGARCESHLCNHSSQPHHSCHHSHHRPCHHPHQDARAPSTCPHRCHNSALSSRPPSISSKHHRHHHRHGHHHHRHRHLHRQAIEDSDDDDDAQSTVHSKHHHPPPSIRMKKSASMVASMDGRKPVSLHKSPTTFTSLAEKGRTNYDHQQHDQQKKGKRFLRLRGNKLVNSQSMITTVLPEDDDQDTMSVAPTVASVQRPLSHHATAQAAPTPKTTSQSMRPRFRSILPRPSLFSRKPATASKSMHKISSRA